MKSVIPLAIFALFVAGLTQTTQARSADSSSSEPRGSSLLATPTARPSKGRIAFTSWRSGISEIYTLTLDGSKPVKLVDGSAPSWSPDGQSIAYIAAAGKHDELFTIRVDDKTIRQLTHSKAGVADPAWSPDGSRIAFTSFDDGRDEIYVIDAEGSHLTRLTTTYGSTPTWTPDGSRIAYICIGEIYTMNPDGSDSKRMMVNTARIMSPGISDLAYSPDGSRIAFTQSVVSHDAIYTMNADGSNIVKLTAEGDFNNASPSWSPDGKQIAFAYYSTSREEIYVMNADGTVPIQLTVGYIASRPAWTR